jgi:hypothetical protein
MPMTRPTAIPRPTNIEPTTIPTATLKRAFYRALSLLISGLNLPFMILGLFGYLTLFRRAETRSIRRLVILRRTTAVQV